MDKVNLTKTSSEVKNFEVAGKFTEWSFTRIITEVEDIIEGNKQVKHSAIQKRIEGVLYDESLLGLFASGKGINKEFLDFPLPV